MRQREIDSFKDRDMKQIDGQTENDMMMQRVREGQTETARDIMINM